MATEPTVPLLVPIAGMILLGCGLLGLCCTCFVFFEILWAVRQGAEGWKNPNAVSVFLLVFVFVLFFGAFAVVTRDGWGMHRGTAKDTLRQALFSLGFGVPLAFFGVGFFMILGGCLALAGRNSYLLWRNAQEPSARS